MIHGHNHIHCHHCMHYCGICNVRYCCKCSEEFASPTYWRYPTTCGYANYYSTAGQSELSCSHSHS
jgi:hypothetical protein